MGMAVGKQEQGRSQSLARQGLLSWFQGRNVLLWQGFKFRGQPSRSGGPPRYGDQWSYTPYLVFRNCFFN
jgi:hypothetical protein